MKMYYCLNFLYSFSLLLFSYIIIFYIIIFFQEKHIISMIQNYKNINKKIKKTFKYR